MKILMVTLGFYPAISWGGPVKIVHQEGVELICRGHEVTVYCSNLFDKRRQIQPRTFEREVDGMRVVYFDTWWLPWWPGTLGPIWLPSLPSHLGREIVDFDVIHLHAARNLMVIPVAQAARKNCVPLVVQPHGGMQIIVNTFFLKRVYDSLLGEQELKGISALIALQESERQQALARGVPDERIEIIPNGLDLSQYSEMPKVGIFKERFEIPDDRLLILFLGRVNKKKGVDMLVEAFSRLENLNAHLAIVGPDDGQLEEVTRLIREYKLEKWVTFTGLLSGDNVSSAYQDADLFVLPCRTDTFPTTIMEACLFNTPMVITEGCESAYLVKDKVADVVPFDVSIFADAMERLLTERDRYERYKASCQVLMKEEFSIGSAVDRLESLYERVISEKQTKRNAIEN